MIKAGLAALWLAAFAVPAAAQIPGLPGFPRPGQQQRPVQGTRDTTRDTVTYHFPAPDSITARLLQMPGYTATRYVGDTVRFDAQTRALDLLAAKKQPAVVERDSQVVVSDSAIYYTESNRRVVTLGNYTLTPPPSSGQAPIKGFGRIDYDLSERSARITHARLPVSQGDMWYLTVDVARIEVDTAGKGNTEWVGGGSMTSCDDSIPDYHFEYKEAKRTGGNTLIARPAILYIKDIPVMWLPFIFSDTRSGRHSGLLPPQFGIGDIVRSSPTYHRSIEHLGYYWAMSDYMDFSTWLDWRSGAGGQAQQDPGWLRLNGDWNYKWLNRFLSGRVGLAYTNQNDGLTNTAISWSHQQDLGRNQHINTSFNYVTSTTLQRQNTFNPYTALQTIASQASYQAKMGPASLTVGATRKQYPGRSQVDQTFPTVTLSSTPVAIGKHFSWTPGFSFSRSDVLAMDQPGLGQYKYTVNAAGVRDSVLSKDRSSANAQMTIDSPIQIFGWDLRNSIRITQQRNNFPQQFQIYDVNTGAVTDTRVFAATYNTNIDWNPDFALPSLGHNKFNLTPSISLQNVDPGPFWVASERTDGHFVHQSKRLTYALNASPTLFGFFPGFGPFSRIRHAITPQISYSYAPAAHVSDEYLIALGKTRKGYLGALQQNQISFGLNQSFEAKRKSAHDTTGNDNGDKIRLLSVNFSPISYDIERAHKVGRPLNGFTSETFTYSLESDLLKGFDFSSTYSLFQGSTLSDTAVFKPVLTGISASFNLSRDQNPFAMFTRLFGRAVPEPTKAPYPPADQVRPTSETNSAEAQALAAQPVAGASRGGDRFIVPPTQGWRASFTFTRSSPRPPTGSGVIDYDPAARCAALVGSTDSFLYNACIDNQRAQPTTDTPVTSNTSGGQLYRIPPMTSINSDVSFNLTPRWAAHWTTTYDVERHEFASHVVQLQRELHDWRAIFGFTQSPNGNFAFNFTIALKAEPDIKFDYNKTTLGAGTAIP